MKNYFVTAYYSQRAITSKFESYDEALESYNEITAIGEKCTEPYTVNEKGQWVGELSGEIINNEE